MAESEMSLKFQDFRDYSIVILVLLYHNCAFFLEIRHTFVAVVFNFILLFAFKRKQILNEKIFLVLAAVWSLIAIQTMLFGGFTKGGVFNPIVNFYMPFLIFVLMGVRFYRYLFNVIYFVALYTSVIYLLHTFIPPFNQLLNYAFKAAFDYSWADWPRSIIIYSAPRESGYFLMRNSGAFHEPGAYAVYLMLGIILNTYFIRKPLHYKNIFLCIVLLSTFSTAGYFILAVFIAYWMIHLKLPVFLKAIVFLPLVILPAMNYYKSAEFLSPKIESQISTQLNYIEQGTINKRGRFYALGMALKSFMGDPFFGRGILMIHQFDVGEIGSIGYGLIGFFARYGLFFGIFYTWFFYKGFLKMSRIYNMPKRFAMISFLIINLGLLSQGFFQNVPFSYFFIIGLFQSDATGKSTKPL